MLSWVQKPFAIHHFLAGFVVLLAGSASASEKDQRLDIYFIDVEGGAATLLVTPSGESMLIDSGYPDNHGRDLQRIIHVAKDVAGLSRIDHAVVSHWHLDHYGNHAALQAELGIGTFWDRGIPDELQEDPNYHERIAAYRSASQNASKSLAAGDSIPLQSGNTPLSVRVLTSGRAVIDDKGKPNPYASRHLPKPHDPSDNAASLSLLFTFGEFRFLTCGDLTWNVEADLVTPTNRIGLVDLFMVTHHGLPVSNNPALVLAIDPVVAVMCNGPTKGGAEQTMQTLREVKSLQDLFQLHQNVQLDASKQAPAEFIANHGPTEGCKGEWVKASVAADGQSYTVRIGPAGTQHTYATRSEH
ncbi:MAG: MBL fold metallo-hydrolase [Planctomycetaceae bacterium]|nr:MBL fold metallo-hydrolase [Planctomycetaceae bacterium]